MQERVESNLINAFNLSVFATAPLLLPVTRYALCQSATTWGTNNCSTFFLLTSFVSVASISYNITRNFLISGIKKGGCVKYICQSYSRYCFWISGFYVFKWRMNSDSWHPDILSKIGLVQKNKKLQMKVCEIAYLNLTKVCIIGENVCQIHSIHSLHQ